VKYWGKSVHQLPMNPSISFSLEKSRTLMNLKVEQKDFSDSIKLSFSFDNKANEQFRTKILEYLISISPYCTYLNHLLIEIESENTFPHSAGIASSASSMSALALCLTSLENELYGIWSEDEKFMQRASWLARLASGSAARSVYSGFSIWGKTKEESSSGNYFAVSPSFQIHPAFSDLYDAILVVKSGSKKLSSTLGHTLMKSHPFRYERIKQANDNLSIIIKSLKLGNWNDFIHAVENEAFTLHALMMSSANTFTLLEPDSLLFVEEIRRILKENNLRLCFTFDAGPNLHVIYDGKQRQDILDCLNPLINRCENRFWIDDKSGDGPRKLK
jgi:diphosphomevalonate decarboxylase